MKMNLKKFRILGLLLAALLCIFLFAGCKKEEEVVVIIDEDTATGVQLLSFESYSEITGTKLATGNTLGKITVNTDSTYITEGEGSMLVEPEGDYTSSSMPWILFDCRYTTFGTNDFSNIEYLSMDVYNDTDEELSITMYFIAVNFEGTEMETTRVTFTLAPNAWTTCVYSVEEKILSSYFDLTDIHYMYLTFNQHKESKDDTPHKIYFDNLYGTYYTETPEVEDYSYSFWDGIGLEEPADLYLFEGTASGTSQITLQRVAYDDLSIEALEDGGDYVLAGDITGSTWPSFTIKYGETVPSGTILTFWVYFEVEVEDGDTYLLDSYTSVERTTKNTLSGENSQFNCWYQVRVLLNGNSDNSYFCFNIDDLNTSAYDCVFGDRTVTVYFDNFKLEYSGDSVTEEDGVITITNPVGTNYLSYVVNQPVKAGQIVSFDVEINEDSTFAIFALGDGSWSYTFFAQAFTDISKYTVSFIASEDVSSFTIAVQFRNENNQADTESDLTGKVITISNISVKNAGDVDYSTIVIDNPNGASILRYEVALSASAGDTIDFTLTMNESSTFAIWILGDGSWDQAYLAQSNHDTTVLKVSTVVPEDISYFSIVIQYRNEDGSEDTSSAVKNKVATITGLTITTPGEASEEDYATIVMDNENGQTYIYTNVLLSAKAGDQITFKLSVNEASNFAVWVLGENSWDITCYAKGYTDTDYDEITATVTQDISYFVISVQYRDANGNADTTSDLTGKVITITDLAIISGEGSEEEPGTGTGESETEVPEITVADDGTITVTNASNETTKTYTIEEALAAGTEISFTISLEGLESEAWALWVLEDGSWSDVHCIYAKGISGTTSQTVSVTLVSDCSYVELVWQYRTSSGSADTTSDKTGVVATISDLTITTYQEEEEEPEGTVITFTNEANASDFSYNIEEELAAGSEISFTISIEGLDSKTWALWVLEDGDWGSAHCLFVEGISGTTTKTVSVTVANDCSYVQIYWQYRTSDESRDTTSDKTGVVATISNLTVTAYEEEVPEGSVITVTNEDNASDLTYIIEEELAAGTEISFTISITGLDSETWAVWVLEDGSWSDGHDIYAYGVAGALTKDVSVTLAHDCSYVEIYWQYRTSSESRDTTSDKTGVVATISNLTITAASAGEEEEEEEEDSTAIVITNEAGDAYIGYTVNKSVSKGDTISFTLTFNEARDFAVWVMTDSTWAGYTGDAWGMTDTQTYTFTTTAAEDMSQIYIMIHLRAAGTTSADTTENLVNTVVTITGYSWYQPEIVITNEAGDAYIGYTINKSVAAGETISFTLTFNEARDFAVWVMTDSTWAGFTGDAWGMTDTQTYTFTTTAAEDMSQVYIMIHLRAAGTTSADTKENLVNTVVTITDYSWYQPEIVITNEAGEAYVNYIVNKSVAAGETISFTLTFNEIRDYAVWVMEDANWTNVTNDAYGMTDSDTVTVSTVAVADMDQICIKIHLRAAGTTSADSEENLVSTVITLTDYSW